MTTFIRTYERQITLLLCGFILLNGLYGSYSALRYSLQDSQDVHLQWFPGQKILRGLNPYVVDNADAPGLVSREGYGHLPTNTAVMSLLFLPLSLMDWDTATWVFRLLNFVLAAAVVVVALRLLPQRLPWWVQVTAIMAFIGTHPVRETILLGQPSLLLLLMMLIAVQLAPRNQWLAGIAFGIALSKVSLSLPVVLWFWLFGYWRVLLVAVLVQVGGFALLAVLTRQDVVDVIAQYVAIAAGLADERGTLDVTSAAQRANIPIASGFTFSILFSLLTLLVVWRRYGWRALVGLRAAVNRLSSERILLFALLCALTLIVVYHRTYDAVLLIILPITFAAKDLAQGRALDLPRLLTAPHFLLAWAVFALLILPSRTIEGLFPAWLDLYPLLLNLMMIGVFAVLLWNCLRYPAVLERD